MACIHYVQYVCAYVHACVHVRVHVHVLNPLQCLISCSSSGPLGPPLSCDWPEVYHHIRGEGRGGEGRGGEGRGREGEGRREHMCPYWM